MTKHERISRDLQRLRDSARSICNHSSSDDGTTRFTFFSFSGHIFSNGDPCS